MTEEKVKVIGITGGVGSGKSELLHYISEHYACRILYADEIAAQMQEPGGVCYQGMRELLGEELFQENGKMDRKLLAEKMFRDASLLQRINDLVHPAVVQEILGQIKEEREKGRNQFVFIEAALLIENGFDTICEELWYIYTDIKVRRERLKQSRGYSDEKIDAVISRQLSEEEFRRHCRVVIDNSNSLQDSTRQISQVLEGYTCHR